MRDRERKREKPRHRQKEKQAPCREPCTGLNPRSPRSHPGLKAGAKLLNHPGCPGCFTYQTVSYMKVSGLFRTAYLGPNTGPGG